MKQTNQIPGLYDPSFEHDNCGIGACVNIKGVKNHQTVDNALKIVETLEHRAGKDAAGETGDGVGILLQISHKFFTNVCRPLGIFLGSERDYGVGMFFFPQDELKRNQAKNIFEVIVEKEGLKFLGWREVPIRKEILGKKALECMPCIMQGFIERPKKVKQGLDFDRRLYVVRRVFEQSSDDTYVASLSSRTIVYKGMFLVKQLRMFFEDLQNPDYESAIAVVHSRFSTNTNPSWERAHPNRFIVHNGEINTIRGNADKMRAREENMESEHLEGELYKVLPAINTAGSDSAMLDNTLEFMVMSGMPLPLAVMITIPEPWAQNATMSQKIKDFYQYYATMMEPWDGPASILFSDGDILGAVLDRNGLRPSRYYITDDDQLILSSEIGVLDIDPTKIVVKERLHPGKMLLVDTIKGKVIELEEVGDEAFSGGMLGEGFAVVPEEGKLYAPVDGIIAAVFRTKHALAMESKEGAEVLIHLGLDTVKRNGKGFYMKVEAGQKVKKGELICEFDLEDIKADGYVMTTPVVISNNEEYASIALNHIGECNVGEEILTIYK